MNEETKKESKVKTFFKDVRDFLAFVLIVIAVSLFILASSIKVIIVLCTFALCFMLFTIHQELEIISKFSRKYFKKKFVNKIK